MDKRELKEYLDTLVLRFNCHGFIEDDPISVPHLFSRKEDIEISGFMASVIAWGNRKAIVKNAHKLISLMDNDPYNFIMDCSDDEILKVGDFVHRTFNGNDCIYYIRSLRNIYRNHGGIGDFFESNFQQNGDIRIALRDFHRLFFSIDHQARAEKHISSIEKGSACKRMNMYIKWMVRKDGCGVDMGLWEKIPSSALYLPLDVHTSNIGRMLGLLTRKQNDWKAVEEITASLREFDPNDPVKYDYALFGAGINKVL